MRGFHSQILGPSQARWDSALDIVAPLPDLILVQRRHAMPEARRTTIDAGEVERFSALAAEWWNPHGKFRPLHKFNPVMLAYIRDQVAARFGRDPHGARPFEGLCFLDIGCGGCLLCESMARLGAEVVGADAS